MSSSSDSSTVTSKASSRAMTSSTRSRLSASRSSPKRASRTTLSSGTWSTSTVQALNLAKVASSLTAVLLARWCVFARSCSLSQSHGQSTVYGEDRTGDVGGVVGGQKDHRPRHLVRCGGTPEGHHGPELLRPLVSQRGDHICVDHPGRH